VTPIQAGRHAQRLRSLLEAEWAQLAPWAQRLKHEVALTPEHRIVLMGFKGKDAEAVLEAYRDAYEGREAGRDQ
jgi:hypothetical protein